MCMRTLTFHFVTPRFSHPDLDDVAVEITKGDLGHGDLSGPKTLLQDGHHVAFEDDYTLDRKVGAGLSVGNTHGTLGGFVRVRFEDSSRILGLTCRHSTNSK